MKTAIAYLKKNLMLALSLTAALVSFAITPPSEKTLQNIDWRTLASLMMMLCVLQGFKKEKVFDPIIRSCGKLKSTSAVMFFVVFGVFFISMLVTNDVSLLIFVPLTISIFRSSGDESLMVPTITLENIAAIRGSLLSPFGSPQNLFIFGKSDISAIDFMIGMSPLCILSGILLAIFILVIKRKIPGKASDKEITSDIKGNSHWSWRQTAYVILMAAVILSIVSRTKYWHYVLAFIIISTLIMNMRTIIEIDWTLLATFLCFFVFSSSIAANKTLADFLGRTVSGNEYWWSIGLSQIVSNVPAAIILHPFSKNIARLIYGLDSAGLVSIIGSLASVINYRLYVAEYPNGGKEFFKKFTAISLLFFAIVVVPGYLLSASDFFNR